MAELKKVEIQLLDPVTGAYIESVNPITAASAVTFTDGKTFQQKLDEGTLRGQQGAQGIQGIKGDKGDQGIKGDKGDTGNQGSKIYNVTSTPSNSIGVLGDWAINTSNGDIFEKTSSTVWTNRGNIKGPQGLRGEIGAQGQQGLKGDTGAQGAKGDKGDPGDGIKVGASLATATDKKIFFKIIG